MSSMSEYERHSEKQNPMNVNKNMMGLIILKRPIAIDTKEK